MQLRTARLRSGTGWLPAIGLALLGATGACSKDDVTPTPGLGDSEPAGAQSVASDLALALDATPSPKADKIFFTGARAQAVDFSLEPAALFVVDAAGGAPTMVTGGFSAPIQVVSSLDGNTMYVADVAVDSRDSESMDAGQRGVIYTTPASGGDKTAIESTRGYQPRGLAVVKINQQELVYFVGTDPSDSMVGLFRFAAPNGSIEVIQKGAPLVGPSCVAVTATGDAYVTDTAAGPDDGGAVVRISGGSASVFVSGLTLGMPAGVSLSQSEKFLLVSGNKPASEGGSSQVYRIELASAALGAWDDDIKHNSNSAGLHRAHEADSHAWGTLTGGVYLVSSKPAN